MLFSEDVIEEKGHYWHYSMEWTGPPPQVFLSILFKFLIEDWWCGWWSKNGLWCDIQSTLAYGVYSISFTIVFHLLHDKVKEGCSCSIRDGFIHLHPRNLPPDKVRNHSGGYVLKMSPIWWCMYLWRLPRFPRHLTMPQVRVAICGWPTGCNTH